MTNCGQCGHTFDEEESFFAIPTMTIRNGECVPLRYTEDGAEEYWPVCRRCFFTAIRAGNAVSDVLLAQSTTRKGHK